MTPERVAEIAEECKFSEYYEEGKFVDYASVTPTELEAFARAVEREAYEAAARVCEEQGRPSISSDGMTHYTAIGQCAAAIRALAK